MKFLKGLFRFILALFALCCGLVMVCAFRPEVTQMIADLLYSERLEAQPESGVGADYEITDVVETESEQEQPDGIGNNVTDGSSDVREEMSLADDHPSSGYMPPSQSEIAVPEKVAGRNGYQPVQEDLQQIEEEAARQLQQQLGMGNTGDGLVFDPLFYPYYAMLDETDQAIYRQIYANANVIYASFAPVQEVNASRLKNIFAAVYNDHPELFWLETAYSSKYLPSGRCVEIDLSFNRTIQDLEEERALFEQNVNGIVARAQGLSGEYEKERFVHDLLIDMVEYDLKAEMGQSAYSALVNGRTVCAGYARAFQYLLQRMGIPCYYCTGYAGENHAWNIVALEDGYYNVDATWDDVEDGIYAYFNRSDSDYADTHIRQEMAVDLPACNGEMYRDLEDDRRSLKELGMTEDQVLTDLESYHGDCYDQVIQGGIGSFTFYNVIEGEELLEAWRNDYKTDAYRQGYMDRAMRTLRGSSCEMELEIEELQDGKYLITHKVSIWQKERQE